MQPQARLLKSDRKRPIIGTIAQSDSLDANLGRHIEAEIGDPIEALKLAQFITSELLIWKIPSVDLVNIGSVIAFSFGNRVQKDGTIVPGPVNELLAQAAIRVFKETGCTVFAQWEIADCIGEEIPPASLFSINPEPSGEGGSVKYLSTIDVIVKVKHIVRQTRSLGRIVVLAHLDHAYRCCSLLRQHGLRSVFGPPFPLPAGYDPKSGQPWTRERQLYLVHELIARLANYRTYLSTSR